MRGLKEVRQDRRILGYLVANHSLWLRLLRIGLLVAVLSWMFVHVVAVML